MSVTGCLEIETITNNLTNNNKSSHKAVRFCCALLFELDLRFILEKRQVLETIFRIVLKLHFKQQFKQL